MAEPPQALPPITLTTGPVAAYPDVLRGLARPIAYDLDPPFQTLFEETTRKAARALRTDAPPLILQGEAVLALEAAAASLIGQRDVVLNLASGEYGKGFGRLARRFAREVVEIETPFDQAIAPDQLRARMAARPEITIVAVCHHETPSGTINPVAEIGRICRDHGALMIVDAVSSWGGMDVHPEPCHADIFVTAASKCLGGVPGLSIVHVSDAAWAHIEANPDAPRGSFLSLTDWRHAWRAGRPFPFTPSIAEVNGLAAALDLYLAEGPERVWARHAATARACRAGLRAMGLRLWPASEAVASPTTTTLRTPEGLDEAQLRAATRERFGVVLAAGRGALAGKVIRVGHMGPVAQPIYATVAVAALGGAIRALGGRADVGAGVEAALAVIAEESPA